MMTYQRANRLWMQMLLRDRFKTILLKRLHVVLNESWTVGRRVLRNVPLLLVLLFESGRGHVA
jgi:hypothetical protein